MGPFDSEEVALAARRIDEREACARLAPAVRLYAMRRLRRAGDVDDFVQEVLLAVVEAIRDGRIGDAEGLGPYTIGICRNMFRDGARTRARRDALLHRFGFLFESGTDPTTGVVSFERVRLDDCVSRLTTNARDVIKRAFVHDESNEEIAAGLGLAEGNVRVIRHRTLKFLRECVEHPVSWEAHR